jgi:hypothetical protein
MRFSRMLKTTNRQNRQKSPFAPVVDIDATRACFARDENARRLLAAGWTPKERMHSHGKGLGLMVDLKSIAVCSNWTMLQPLRNDPS